MSKLFWTLHWFSAENSFGNLKTWLFPKESITRQNYLVVVGSWLCPLGPFYRVCFFSKNHRKPSLVGAAVSVRSASARLCSLFLCPGVYCKWHHSYWAFHENVSFSRSWTLGSIFGVFASNAKNMLNGTSSRLRPLGPWWALHGCRRRLEWLSRGSSTEAGSCAAP